MSDDLRDGIACWLAREDSLDWDELDEYERGGYRCSATDLLRFVREPLSEAAAQPPAPITAEDVRAAEAAWLGNGIARDPHVSKAKAAFVADYLNRRGER